VFAFTDRRQAGSLLGEAVSGLRLSDPVVIGLPRGGVVVAKEVATRLSADLDVLVVRKVGAPGQPELGIGAVAEGEEDALLAPMAHQLVRDPAVLQALVEEARRALAAQAALLRGTARAPLDVRGREVVVIDDGIATGVTMEAAVGAIRKRGAKRVVVAAPVAAEETAKKLESIAEVCVLLRVRDLWAVGVWYQDFTQVTDQEVLEALGGAAGGKGTNPEVNY